MAGVAAGAVQAALLARSTGTVAVVPAFLLRYAIVAVVLVVAARAGYLIPAAAGWAGGFAISAGVAYRGLG
jgi:hypothetical protein